MHFRVDLVTRKSELKRGEGLGEAHFAMFHYWALLGLAAPVGLHGVVVPLSSTIDKLLGWPTIFPR